MRTIPRHQAPPYLAQQPQSQAWRDFMLKPEHGQLTDLLTKEQQGLCCYCELKVSECGGHLEHLVPRSAAPARTYDYTNLAISCNGGSIEHCGHYKDDSHHNPHYSYNAALFSPPDASSTTGLFRYLSNGEIKEATTPPHPSATYMIKYLGLDCTRLTDRRRAHADRITDTLGDEPDQDLLDWLCSEYLQPGANGTMQEFYSLSKALLSP